MKSAVESGTWSHRCTHAVRINRPAIALYAAWRNLAHRPSDLVRQCLMASIERERNAVIKAPCAGATNTALLVDQIPGVFLAWRSLPQAGVQECGEVWFHPIADLRCTEVRVTLSWEPADDTASLPAWEHARESIEQNLDCFKRLMES